MSSKRYTKYKAKEIEWIADGVLFETRFSFWGFRMARIDRFGFVFM